MKKLEKRALLCILLSIVLMVGMGYFVFTFVTEGNEWAAFYTNRAVNSNGHLARGTLKDVNGTTLLKNRHGSIGKIPLMWLPEYTTYANAEKHYDDAGY